MQILKKVIWKAALLFSGAIGITYADIVYAEANINQNAAENNLIYNFKNTKKEGTVTFTKKWKDRKNNDDRPIPDIEISTNILFLIEISCDFYFSCFFASDYSIFVNSGNFCIGRLPFWLAFCSVNL